MEIDPKKIDINKTKPYENSENDKNTNQAKNIDSVSGNAKRNPAPLFTPPVKTKTPFVAVGVLGIIIIILFFVAYSVLNNAGNDASDVHYDKSEDTNNAEETFEDTIKNRDKQRIFDLNSISKILKRYKEENGIYPVSRISVKLNEDNQVTEKIKSANEDVDIPVDPNDPGYYYSYQSASGKSFEIAARLENMEDKDCEIINNMCIYKISD